MPRGPAEPRVIVMLHPDPDRRACHDAGRDGAERVRDRGADHTFTLGETDWMDFVPMMDMSLRSLGR